MSFWKMILSGSGRDRGSVLSDKIVKPPMPPVSPPKHDVWLAAAVRRLQAFVAWAEADDDSKTPGIVPDDIDRLLRAFFDGTRISNPEKLDWRVIAKLAGEYGVRYRTNTALANFLSAISPDIVIHDDADLECEYDPDGSYTLVWKTGYAITAFPNGRVCVTKSPRDTAVPPFGCDVSELVKKPD